MDIRQGVLKLLAPGVYFYGADNYTINLLSWAQHPKMLSIWDFEYMKLDLIPSYIRLWGVVYYALP